MNTNTESTYKTNPTIQTEGTTSSKPSSNIDAATYTEVAPISNTTPNLESIINSISTHYTEANTEVITNTVNIESTPNTATIATSAGMISLESKNDTNTPTYTEAIPQPGVAIFPGTTTTADDVTNPVITPEISISSANSVPVSAPAPATSSLSLGAPVSSASKITTVSDDDNQYFGDLELIEEPEGNNSTTFTGTTIGSAISATSSNSAISIVTNIPIASSSSNSSSNAKTNSMTYTIPVATDNPNSFVESTQSAYYSESATQEFIPSHSTNTQDNITNTDTFTSSFESSSSQQETQHGVASPALSSSHETLNSQTLSPSSLSTISSSSNGNNTTTDLHTYTPTTAVPTSSSSLSSSETPSESTPTWTVSLAGVSPTKTESEDTSVSTIESNMNAPTSVNITETNYTPTQSPISSDTKVTDTGSITNNEYISSLSQQQKTTSSREPDEIQSNEHVISSNQQPTITTGGSTDVLTSQVNAETYSAIKVTTDSFIISTSSDVSTRTNGEVISDEQLSISTTLISDEYTSVAADNSFSVQSSFTNSDLTGEDENTNLLNPSKVYTPTAVENSDSENYTIQRLPTESATATSATPTIDQVTQTPTAVVVPTSVTSLSDDNSDWLPKSIIYESEFGTTVSTSFNPSATKSLPQVIAPPTNPTISENSTLITIGLKRGLNYEFLVSNPLSSAQIFNFLPEVLSYPFMNFPNNFDVPSNGNLTSELGSILGGHNFNESNTDILEIVPLVVPNRDYFISVVEVYFPKELLYYLEALMSDRNSSLYAIPNDSLSALARLIDTSIPLTGLVTQVTNTSTSTALPSGSSYQITGDKHNVKGNLTSGFDLGNIDAYSRDDVEKRRKLSVLFPILFPIGIFICWCIIFAIMSRNQRRLKNKQLLEKAFHDIDPSNSYNEYPYYSNYSNNEKSSRNHVAFLVPSSSSEKHVSSNSGSILSYNQFFAQPKNSVLYGGSTLAESTIHNRDSSQLPEVDNSNIYSEGSLTSIKSSNTSTGNASPITLVPRIDSDTSSSSRDTEKSTSTQLDDSPTSLFTGSDVIIDDEDDNVKDLHIDDVDEFDEELYKRISRYNEMNRFSLA